MTSSATIVALSERVQAIHDEVARSIHTDNSIRRIAASNEAELLLGLMTAIKRAIVQPIAEVG